MRIENSELRAFQAVIEAHGFNRAAKQLHISQSAVSQSIANLEAKLDVKLLLRDKELTLTAAGKRLFDYAKEVLREEQQVFEDLSRIKQGDQQLLNLAINSTINRFYAPALLGIFCQQQKDTQLKVAELPSRDLIYSILSGRAELAMGPFQKKMDAFSTVPLFHEKRYLVISPKHNNFTSTVRGEAKTLRQTPLITSSLDNPEMRPAIQRIRDRFKSVWEISSLSMRIHLVDQGLGVAYIDSKLLEEHPVCKEFIVMEALSFSCIERQVGLYYKKGKVLNESCEAFIQLCEKFWATK